MNDILNFASAILVALAFYEVAPAQEGRAHQTQANVMVEVSFDAKVAHKDPFNSISLDVLFTDPNGKELRVPAFWAGGKTWKVRYASPAVGTHQFRSDCSDARDTGLHGVTGTVQITPYTGENPVYKHGPIRV